MYLHIGSGISIKNEDIIGIFDLDTATVSKITKNFIKKNEKNGDLEYEDTDLPRSFIIYERKNEKKVRLSRISSSGLKMRIDGEYKVFGE